MICNTYIQFFRMMADPSRVQILFALKDNSLYVQELVQQLGKEQSTISHNLKKLKNKGFVESEKDGRMRKYYLNPEIQQMLELMDNHIKKNFHDDCRCGR